MKKVWLILGLACCVALTASCQKKEEAAAKSAAPASKTKISYALGLSIGKNLASQELVVDARSLAKGVRDGLNKKDTMKEEEMIALIRQFQEEQQKLMMKKREEMSKVNAQKESQFLADNQKKPGWKVTADGLQYRVIKSGSGSKTPVESDRVTVHYIGKLLDGKEFDNSYKRNQPATFQVGGVIKGWQEALKLMKPGDKFEVIIPSKLAYGEQGAGQLIGPNATLQFEIELLSVN